jgi:hypothetical protein
LNETAIFGDIWRSVSAFGYVSGVVKKGNIERAFIFTESGFEEPESTGNGVINVESR